MQEEIKYHLKTPAYENGTTTSPWRAKIQRIGLLNTTCRSTEKDSDVVAKRKKNRERNQNASATIRSTENAFCQYLRIPPH